MSRPIDMRGAGDAELVGALRDAGLRVGAGDAIAWARGEARLVDARGEVLVRVVPRVEGVFVEACPEVADRARCRALGAALGGRLRLPSGFRAWDPPFDRGPGLYRLAEIDRAAVAAASLEGVDVRVAYLASTCAGECTFCRHVERETDAVPERFALDALARGDDDVRGAYVCLGGPEPTDSPLLDLWVRALRDRGAATVALIGTADALADRARAATLRDAGLEAIALPLYAADAAGHDAVVRRAGAFVRACAVVDACRAEGLAVYLHTLLLGDDAPRLEALRAFAERLGLPLTLGLPRPKSAGALPIDARVIGAAAAIVEVVGAPLCLLARAPGDPVARGAALLRRHGPIAIYLAVQAGAFGAPCADCGVRARCAGLPAGLLDALGPDLAKVSA